MDQRRHDTGHLILAAALGYAARGWRVIPTIGKRPRFRRWPARATTGEETIRGWWEAMPSANVGVVVGRSFLAFDVDPRHNGDEALDDREGEIGALPPAPRYRTGGEDGGWRLLFQHPGIQIISRLGTIEIKRGSQVVVMPPSLHPLTRRRYEWEVEPEECELPELPPAWVDLLRHPRRAERRGYAGPPSDALERWPPDDYISRLTGTEVGADGKIACPAFDHEDRTPSLQVYETAERGWYCFGCGRGGGIYEFAALVAGIPTPLRGDDFKAVRAALLDLYGE